MKRLLVALALAALVLVPSPATARVNPMQNATAATVPVRAITPQGTRSFCSAVVVQPGVALTADHCYIGERAYIEQAGRLLPITGTVQPSDADDVRVLTVPGLECPCAPLGTAADVKEGADVIVIGYPRGGPQKVTEGKIVSVDETVCYGFDMISEEEFDCFQQARTNAPAQPGNSGGPVFVIRDGVAYVIGLLVGGGPAGTYVEIIVR